MENNPQSSSSNAPAGSSNGANAQRPFTGPGTGNVREGAEKLALRPWQSCYL